MSETGYVVWFILMAVAIAALLGVGTVIAAGVVRLPHRHREEPQLVPVTDAEDHHHHFHWFHRAA